MSYIPFLLEVSLVHREPGLWDLLARPTGQRLPSADALAGKGHPTRSDALPTREAVSADGRRLLAGVGPVNTAGKRGPQGLHGIHSGRLLVRLEVATWGHFGWMVPLSEGRLEVPKYHTAIRDALMTAMSLPGVGDLKINT
jgi:hypothetical protein